jgi:formylglycine-generating enzyme required for sulfatase activity
MRYPSSILAARHIFAGKIWSDSLTLAVIFSLSLAVAGELRATEPPPTYRDRLTGMEFVWVEGGCYIMGDGFATDNEDELPPHEVCVDGFYIGKYEVTQAEYVRLMEFNPSRFQLGPRFPVEQVSWDDARLFISTLGRLTGLPYRLPTEAEWEYAARSGGKEELFAGGGEVTEVGWFYNNSDGQTHAVGGKLPNGLGIHDMSGNVYEWCGDWYEKGYYHNSPGRNPQGPSSGKGRVTRGGGRFNSPDFLRTANRFSAPPETVAHDLGFRLVLPLEKPKVHTNDQRDGSLPRWHRALALAGRAIPSVPNRLDFSGIHSLAVSSSGNLR